MIFDVAISSLSQLSWGLQETIVRLERECEVEKARVLQLQEKVAEVKGHEEHLTEEIQKKNTLIDQLHQSIGRMQQDYKSQIQNTVCLRYTRVHFMHV